MKRLEKEEAMPLNYYLTTSVVLVQFFLVFSAAGKTSVEHEEHWHHLNKLVQEASDSQQYQKGVPLAEEAYRFALETFGESHEYTTDSRWDLAELYEDVEHYDKAVALFELDLKINRENLLLKPLYYRLFNLGSLYRFLHRYDEAVPIHEEMVEIQREVPREHSDLVMTLDLLASVSLKAGRYVIAEKTYRELLALKPIESGDTPFLIVVGFVRALEKQGRYDEAISFAESVRSNIEAYTPSDGEGSNILIMLGSLYEKKENYDDAELVYKQAIELSPRASFHHQNGLLKLYQMYKSQDRSKEAARALKDMLNANDEQNIRELIERGRPF